jgi:hypothetical protein
VGTYTGLPSDCLSGGGDIIFQPGSYTIAGTSNFVFIFILFFFYCDCSIFKITKANGPYHVYCFNPGDATIMATSNNFFKIYSEALFENLKFSVRTISKDNQFIGGFFFFFYYYFNLYLINSSFIWSCYYI